MKTICLLMSLVLMVSLSGLAHAKGKGGEKKPPKNKLKGEIVKVDHGKLSVKVGKKKDLNAREVVVATDANTQVILGDGTAGQVSDLKPGMKVDVAPAEGTAVTITVKREAQSP